MTLLCLKAKCSKMFKISKKSEKNIFSYFRLCKFKKTLHFLAEIQYLSMILVFFNKFQKSKDKICPCIGLID
jgi:hypothetical protein